MQELQSVRATPFKSTTQVQTIMKWSDSVELPEAVTTDDWKGVLSTLSGKRHTAEVSTLRGEFRGVA
jgi:hypothetical protein